MQCCEEKCFFPDTRCTPGTAPALLMGSQGLHRDIAAIIPGHREQGGGSGPFPRGQLDGLDVAGHSPPLSANSQETTGI